MKAADPNLKATALAIRAAGVSLLPIDHRTKRPLSRQLPPDGENKPTWKPFQLEIAVETVVRGWFDAGAKSFAVIGGAVSGGLLILDFDVARFYDAWKSKVGELAYGLPVQRTGGGGYQVFCRCPEPGENVKLAWVPCETEKSGRKTAIETRAEGGYAVVPPSLHPTGNYYLMLCGDLTAIPMISQARADALLEAARKLDECPYTRQEKERIEREAAQTHERKVAASRTGNTGVIQQFNAAHSIDKILETHGYTRFGDRFVRPDGKSPSVSIKNGRSCHFSSNDPLNDGKVKSGVGIHDAFDVYAYFEHGGDVKAAVKGAARLLGIELSAPTIGKVKSDGLWQPKPEQIVEFPEPMRLAEHYLKHRQRHGGEFTLRRYREQWWKFDHGGYRQMLDEIILADLYRHVDRLWTPRLDKDGNPTGEYTKLVARGSTCGELGKALPACRTIVDGDMPLWLDGRSSPHPADVVAFRNGLIDTAAMCRGELKLLPLTPLWFSGVACPFNFDPIALCPQWLEFLQQVFDGDPESIALLQEWFGLNMVPDNQYEKFLMLVGAPRSGKGTVLEVLGATLGEGQAASTSFTKLSSRFGLAPLVGRLAAILPDAHIGFNTDPKGALETIKSVTGNDPQAIDRKGIDELPRVRLYCRFSIAVNELPKLPDEAGALKTRLLLLHFRNSVAGREDTMLKPRLKAEASGVAVWALEGLKRLRQNARFTTPERSAAMIAAFEKILSPVLSFLDECCELTNPGEGDIYTEKDLLFRAWEAWSKDRGENPGSKADFGQALLNANRGISAAKRGPRGQQFTVYTGVRLCQ